MNKLNEVYISNGENKLIKIISILKDKEIINNLCEYIKYMYKMNRTSNYNAPYNKFNTPNHYFISSYLDIYLLIYFLRFCKLYLFIFIYLFKSIILFNFFK